VKPWSLSQADQASLNATRACAASICAGRVACMGCRRCTPRSTATRWWALAVDISDERTELLVQRLLERNGQMAGGTATS
jgi:hypothetical protein